MSERVMVRRLAGFLRRNPWLVVGARGVWRLTRPRFTAGVVGVVFNDANQVLLVEHVFHPYVPWGLPGGWVERNEHPALGVSRELQEELSLQVTVGPIVAMDYVGNAHLDLAYLCVAHGPVGKLSYELLQYGWFDPNDLPHTHTFHRTAIAQALELRLAALQG